MPPRSRKKKIIDEDEKPKQEEVGATVMQQQDNTEDKGEARQEARRDHVVVQLSIPSNTIDEIIRSENFQEILEYRPDIQDPIPYQACDLFESQQVHLIHSSPQKPIENHSCTEKRADTHTPQYHENRIMCFWCCHDIGASRFGMPVAYDASHDSFSMYGHFCSLECCAAHNFSVHMGCDRMWEIHSWIQLYARKIGYGTPVRPAPNRYLLKMFGGPMTIDDFRLAHKGTARTVVMNIPPLINIQSQVESINTSFLFKSSKSASATATSMATTTGMNGAGGAEHDEQPTHLGPNSQNALHVQNGDKSKLTRKRSIVEQKKTLDFKMNLSYE